ncbi:MAG TPA: TrmH family RNA methyltransferase [Caldithrix abyssi]|uniref:TrmH family RNA methyltransferase n=1 Tax=Caldithrix abyssi TaxID=187145 RepID=A0A7V5VEZ7_CALAY|nr:TrmH family RNA methyltransferase [Caldithrix abyssi]
MSGLRKLTFEEIMAMRPDAGHLEELPRVPLVALVENIRSMHNVGSIFRSSDGAGIRHLYLTGFTPVPPRPEIEKTALGATESVPWSYHKKAADVVRDLKDKGYEIVVVEQTTGSRAFFKTTFNFPLCLIMGNEVDGVSDELVALADKAVDIPMRGIKHSLNVSVAYGIVVYGILAKYL